ncbi:MAG: response regulator transcription factor [Burkholderiales bacterium]|nr:response regulator transcription factor [Burkholderiales bacterium]
MTTTPIRCLIADDEPLMRERLRELLAAHAQDFALVAEASHGGEALALFESERPAVCFLDIRMPERSGLEVAAEIGERAHIVFCTAYEQFAVDAFERGAVDYLLKPIEEERFELTLDRLRERVQGPPEDMTPLLHLLRGREGSVAAGATPRLKWVKALVGHDVRMFAVDEVIFFQADTKYTRVVTDSEDVLIRTSLRELADALDPEQFWQVHRSAIVNVRRIQRVLREGSEKHSLVLRGTDEKIPVSRHFFHLFRQM